MATDLEDLLGKARSELVDYYAYQFNPDNIDTLLHTVENLATFSALEQLKRLADSAERIAWALEGCTDSADRIADASEKGKDNA